VPASEPRRHDSRWAVRDHNGIVIIYGSLFGSVEGDPGRLEPSQSI
jgi:hypothetical protein